MTIGGAIFVGLFMFLLGAMVTYVAIRLSEKAVGGPVAEALGRMDEQVRALEQARIGAYARLSEQVSSLKGQTQQLAQALVAPIGRGRWGELQLRRVVELAGMLEHCDFAQQVTVGEEHRQRPDMVIR